MHHPGYHYKCFVATHELRHMIYGTYIMCSIHEPKLKTNVTITGRAHSFHGYMYITLILLLYIYIYIYIIYMDMYIYIYICIYIYIYIYIYATMKNIVPSRLSPQ